MSVAALHLDGVTLARGGRVLAAPISLAVAPGEAVAVLGPNGAGKTTLLRVVAGLTPAAGGALRFHGPGGPLEPADARARHLHWLPWQDPWKAARTARAELEFAVAWAGGAPADAARALSQAGLAALAERPVRTLSAGQRRRLSLARLLATPRALWLLDEPLAPLDAAWRAAFGAAMRAHLDGGGMILAAVHDPLPVPATSLRLAPPAAAQEPSVTAAEAA